MATGSDIAEQVRLGKLTRRAEFLRARGGRSWAAPSLVIQARERPENGRPARFGFTATKKLGSAVKRNRARRRLKEAVRLSAARHARPGYDY
ncbi:MAG: ribonuclease P protein component, partial [Alphaproteobacteria bacterium]